jgi:hypothetical protein
MVVFVFVVSVRVSTLRPGLETANLDRLDIAAQYLRDHGEKSKADRLAGPYFQVAKMRECRQDLCHLGLTQG